MKIEGIYKIMVEKAKNDVKKRFLSMNGRDILDFPLHVPVDISIDNFLEDTFGKYMLLIEELKFPIIEECKDDIKDLCKCLLKVTNTYLSGDTYNAFRYFLQIMRKGFDSIPISDISKTIFYRMRKDLNLKNESDFHPLTPSLRYLCKTERFSVSGYPCFYLGYSEKVCIKEISGSGSMISMKLKPGNQFKVVDLTYLSEKENNSAFELQFIKAWPLIAACYIVPYYCLRKKKECPPEPLFFKEEYIIPQFLTQFIRIFHKEIKGIRYYSVKDTLLDPLARGVNDMRNLVLFTDASDDNENLCSKFEWYTPYNV